MRYLLLISFLGVSVPGFATKNTSVGAVLWEQTSAEYRALCYQVYNMAKISLDKLIKQKRTKKPAVVLDVDQTVLSHHLYAGYLAKNNKKYGKKTWNKWMKSLKSTSIPGALGFIRYAKKKGVEVFYITNMKAKISPLGLLRMKQLGFTNANKKYFFPRTKEKSKDKRRAIIEKTHEIIMFIGDQLTDMPGFNPKGVTIENRFSELEKQKNKLGIQYFILPNTTYGAWASALDHNLDKNKIEAWKPVK